MTKKEITICLDGILGQACALIHIAKVYASWAEEGRNILAAKKLAGAVK